MIQAFKQNLIELYLKPRVLSIAFFAFPYGMMFFLAISTPQIWLKEIGVAKTNIGFFALVSIPYVLKFLWAPMVDVVKIPFLHRMGQRRSWLIFIHSSLIVGLLALGLSNPTPDNFWVTGFIALLLAFLAATQDIIIDAYRIEILDKNDSIPGVSMLIFGYRIGSLVAKAGPLYLAYYFNWTVAYCIMAVLVSVGIFTTLLNPEPVHLEQKSRSLYQTFLQPLQEFIGRSPFWPSVFLFCILYRLGDAMINNMASIFYLEMGFTLPQIASVTNVFGICATILGGFLGAVVVRQLKVYGSLLFCGITHTLSHLLFLLLTITGNDLYTLYGVIAVEHMTGGMSTCAFFVYLSRLCRLNFTATQFALLTSLWSLATPLASISGWLVDCLQGNWFWFFCCCVGAALPGLLLIFVIQKYPLGNEGAVEPN